MMTDESYGKGFFLLLLLRFFNVQDWSSKRGEESERQREYGRWAFSDMASIVAYTLFEALGVFTPFPRLYHIYVYTRFKRVITSCRYRTNLKGFHTSCVPPLDLVTCLRLACVHQQAFPIANPLAHRNTRVRIILS